VKANVKKYSVLGILVVLILFLAFYPREKIFTIDVFTEMVSFRISDPQFSEWDISGASIEKSPYESVEVKSLLEGSRLMPAKGVEVRLKRHGIGPIYLRLTCDEGSVGMVDEGDGVYTELGNWALITVNADSEPEIFPFRGFLDIGDDVAVDVNSVLLSGKISIVEEKLFTNGHYTAGEEVLVPGDRVQLWKQEVAANKPRRKGACIINDGTSVAAKVRTKSELDGFIRAEPVNNYTEPVNALNLVAHGKADYAKINRFGSAGYEVKTHVFTRFINDPILLMLLGTLAAFSLLMEVIAKTRDFMNSKEKDVDTDD